MKTGQKAALLIAILAVVAATGWIWFNSGAEWSVPGGTVHPAPPASVELKAVSPPLASSASAPLEPSQADYAEWKAEMARACASVETSLHIAHFDVDGDKVADTVCWRVLKTPAHRDFIDVQARVRHAGRWQTAYAILPFDGAVQYGVCGPPDAIKVEQRLWTRQNFDDLGWDYIGPVSIAINGGGCDPPWLFWPKDASSEEVDFDFERM